MTRPQTKNEWKNLFASELSIQTLSSMISYGLNNEDIKIIDELYYGEKHLQKRIIALLEFCNFHYECDLLLKGEHLCDINANWVRKLAK